MEKITVVGITNCGSFANYEKWFLAERDVEVVHLDENKNNLDDVERCDGIVLSGGEDIHPRYYKREEYIEFCKFNEQRDEFEWRVLEKSVQHQQPLFGICRGLQVANVFFGGTLLPDIPSFGKFNHSKFSDLDRYHNIRVDNNSLLARITDEVEGKINSAHHQSADRVGKELVANCFSPDGVIEGIEWKEPEGKPFMMLVQWHPERMTDQTSPFSRNIKLAFLAAARDRKGI
jgi:putative glutamine amidotransferase